MRGKLLLLLLAQGVWSPSDGWEVVGGSRGLGKGGMFVKETPREL